MNVLVACEFSGVVRDAFRELGHNAWSCDLLPSDNPDHHLQGDALDLCHKHSWDLIIAHPPCTCLAVSGARWWVSREKEQEEAINFFLCFLNKAPKVCIENPVGIMSTRYRKPDQYIQPWQFGHGETKKTGLWLQNLPLLKPTNIVAGREARIHKMPPSKDRGRLRSLTYTGIAAAMADQWGTK